MTTELQQQIEREQAELAAAPVVQSTGMAVRCHFCGQLAATITLVERLDTGNYIHERWKGECCSGGAG